MRGAHIHVHIMRVRRGLNVYDTARILEERGELQCGASMTWHGTGSESGQFVRIIVTEWVYLERKEVEYGIVCCIVWGRYRVLLVLHGGTSKNVIEFFARWKQVAKKICCDMREIS